MGETVQGDYLFQGILHLVAFELLINSSGDERGREVCCMQLELSKKQMLTQRSLCGSLPWTLLTPAYQFLPRHLGVHRVESWRDWVPKEKTVELAFHNVIFHPSKNWSHYITRTNKAIQVSLFACFLKAKWHSFRETCLPKKGMTLW